MSIKEFDKLEERIGQLVTAMKQLREENLDLKAKIQEFEQDGQQRDVERGEVKKRISSLIDMISTLENDAPHR